MNSRLRQIFTREFTGRAIVFAEALGAFAVILVAIWELHRHVVFHWIPITPLSLGVACILLQTFLALLLLSASAAIKRYQEILLNRTERRQPQILEHLAAYSLHGTGELELSDFFERDAGQFETCLLDLLRNTGGQARERLTKLATTFGLVKEWTRKAERGNVEAIESLGLLSSPQVWCLIEQLAAHESELIRAAALRMLVREVPGGASVDPSRVFTLVFSSPLLIRVMLAGELRQCAPALIQKGVAESLANASPAVLLAALEMLESWRCGLLLKDMNILVRHPDSRIRAAAIRLASADTTRAGADHGWARLRAHDSRSNSNSLVPVVIAALEDSDVRVRSAALSAAARMGIRTAVASIARCAEDSVNASSSLACSALAAMGEEGHAVLEEKVRRGGPLVAANAAESLAAAKLSPRMGGARN